MRKVLFILALLTLILPGCSKKEFTVEIQLPADVDRTYTFLYYASDPAKGWLMENVAAVQRGKAKMTGIVSNPCLVYIFGSGRIPQALFYVEKGSKIKIEGRDGNPTDWTISGNPITERLTKWRLDNKSTLASGDAGKINSAVTAHVKANPDDPVSAILLQVYFKSDGFEKDYAKAWKMLKGDAADAKWMELSARSDLLNGVPENKEFPSMVVFKTVGNGCDTIRKGKVPMILYFTKNGLSSHRQDMDSLKKLSREFPDSGLRFIIDVSLEPDSSSRTYTIRRDTIKGGMRAWMPLGVNDETAERMGVKRIPYFIVVDKKGRTAYRGDSPVEASAAFRRAAK